MNSLLSNKYVWLLLITLGLQIPLSMIESQIEDRVKQREIARTSVRNSWTGEQDILAALLVIPYQEKILVKQQDNLKKIVLGQKLLIECHEFDKYGRLLITIYDQNSENVSEILIKNGFGRSYDGGHKKKWFPE